MKKVLWFSRHEMTDEQKAALGIINNLQEFSDKKKE